MKKIFVTILGLMCASALVVNAQDAKASKRHLTTEQKALQKEILEKYDTNKNGKLDKAERAKISKEDQERLEKAGLGPKKTKATKAAEKAAPAPAPAPAPTPAPTPAPAPAPAAQ